MLNDLYAITSQNAPMILSRGRRDSRQQRVNPIEGMIDAFSRWVKRSYIKKWVVVGVFIGIIAGIGSLVLYLSIKLATEYILTGITGYVPPSPISEGGSVNYTLHPYRYWLIPVSTGLGGLLSGLLVYGFAPEAEGHGTDAAIEAFHFRNGKIRRRIPPVKLVASAITIGSGGSAGREGPVAQIAAGFGSYIADLFRLDDRDRRIAVAAGIGAGIGSIFMAPLGGALLSTEVLYRRDFEVDALVPSIIASVTGYSIFGYFFDYRPLFQLPSPSAIGFFRPESLILYALVGIITGVLGIGYVITFYGVKRFFSRQVKIPNYVRPAIAGVLVGLIAIELPQILGLGYGWVQLILFDKLALLPLWIIIVLVAAKIFATSLSIGSGGSGGVYAPGIVIGTFIGAVIYIVFHPLFPFLTIADVVIVSMISFFGGVSKAPISIIIMGTEMTGGFALFLPLMLATITSYFISGTKYSIYSMQVLDRAHSPAHAAEYEKPLMDYISIRDAMNSRIATFDANMQIADAAAYMTRLQVTGAVLLSGPDIVGYVSAADAAGNERSGKIRDIATRPVGTISADLSVHDAFNLLTAKKLQLLAVIDAKRGNQITGIIGLSEIASAYNRKIGEIPHESEELF